MLQRGIEIFDSAIMVEEVSLFQRIDLSNHPGSEDGRYFSTPPLGFATLGWLLITDHHQVVPDFIVPTPT